MSNGQEKKLVFIAAVLGNKVKRRQKATEGTRTFVLMGGKNWCFEGFFFKSPRWCSLDLGTDYHLECTHTNNTGLA